MDRDEKKSKGPVIDEALMMSLMVEGVKKDGLKIPDEPPKDPVVEKPVSKERGRQKKNQENDYESIFLKKSDSNARNGKSVYIRPEFHETLSRIVQVIGEDKISIYAYLDNLLEHHFAEFGDQITTSFNNKYKPIL